MHRTQLYLDDDVYRALAAQAATEGKTLSEIVRDRLAKAVAGPFVDPLRAIDRAFGAWRDADRPDTETLVRALRKSGRVKHGAKRPARRRR